MTLVRLCPLELTERQSVLLTNPAYGAHGIKVTNTIRIAISIYKTGDVARPHMHTPNASRTIISDGGGYTMVEGERIRTRRGDLVFTPNGTWHGHGNRSEEHTSELQSLMRISYAVFCLKKKHIIQST